MCVSSIYARNAHTWLVSKVHFLIFYCSTAEPIVSNCGYFVHPNLSHQQFFFLPNPFITYYYHRSKPLFAAEIEAEQCCFYRFARPFFLSLAIERSPFVSPYR